MKGFKDGSAESYEAAYAEGRRDYHEELWARFEENADD